MNIIRNILIGLLVLIVLLCGLIGLGALFPGLYDRFGKNPEDTGEPAAVEEISPVAEAVEVQPAKPVTESSPVPEAAALESSASDNEAADSLPGLLSDLHSDYVPGTGTPSVPSALKALTGFSEPHGTKNVLDPKKADEVESSLSTGPTGDDLTFDEEFYPYYHMLDDKGKHVYRQIYANAKELNPDFRSVEKDIPFPSLMNVFEAVFNDHPELYWLNTEYSAGYRDSGDCLELILSFNRTAKDIAGSSAEFNTGADRIGQAASGDAYSREKAVHDAICNDFSYSLSAEMNQSAYSGFANHSTVCAGYARAFQYVMTSLGIPCYYCRGTAGEPHAWNIIKLDGDYYNVDVTWDDSDQTWQYEYLNLSDDEISKDHRRTGLSVYLPACNGGKYSHLEQPPEDDAEEDDDDDTEPDNEDSGPAELPEGTYVNSLEEYFDKCYNYIMEKGKGTYSFDIYTTDKDVYNSCMSAYADGSAKSGYMNEIFEATERARGFSVDFTGREGSGVYKMTQKVRLY